MPHRILLAIIVLIVSVTASASPPASTVCTGVYSFTDNFLAGFGRSALPDLEKLQLILNGLEAFCKKGADPGVTAEEWKDKVKRKCWDLCATHITDTDSCEGACQRAAMLVDAKIIGAREATENASVACELKLKQIMAVVDRDPGANYQTIIKQVKEIIEQLPEGGAAGVLPAGSAK